MQKPAANGGGDEGGRNSQQEQRNTDKPSAGCARPARRFRDFPFFCPHFSVCLGCLVHYSDIPTGNMAVIPAAARPQKLETEKWGQKDNEHGLRPGIFATTKDAKATKSSNLVLSDPCDLRGQISS